jgi:hypothetical protein
VLVIRVELWPGGDERRKRELALMTIANDGTGDIKTGNYVGSVFRKGALAEDCTKRPLRSAEVKGYKRLNLHVWNLVARMLGNMGYK